MIDDTSSETSVVEHQSASEQSPRQDLALPVLDPKSVLPQHLQRKSYKRDIWQRIREASIRNPGLTRDSLEKNVETREIILQVILAASEREKEILLHNQARLFSQILSDVVRSAKHTLSTPLPVVPRNWIEASRSVPIAHSETSDSNVQSSGSGEATGYRWIQKILPSIIVSLVTPKVFISIIMVFFAGAAGYSQLQIHNLKNTIDSYKYAESASRKTTEELNSLIDSMEKTRNDMDAQVADLNQRNASLDNDLRKKEEELVKLSTQNESNLVLISQLRSELSASQKEESEQLGSVREQLRSVREENKRLVSDLAVSEDRERSERERRIIADEHAGKFQEMANSNSSQKRELELQIRTLNLKNLELHEKVALSGIGETFVNNVRRQIGPFTDPNEEEIEQYIREYDAAKEVLTRPRNPGG